MTIHWHPAALPYQGRVVQWFRNRKCRRRGHDMYTYLVRFGGVITRHGYCLRCGVDHPVLSK